jgi:hypothetical protein
MTDTKHARYEDSHVPGEVFWGIGVENETYLALKQRKEVPGSFLWNQARERYSVNYWQTYKNNAVSESIRPVIPTSLRLPQLLNGHSLTRCDASGEHRTTYTKNPAPNPRFKGSTVIEDLSGARPDIFGKGARDVWWCFDGDTIEFMTQQFRCVTIEDVVEELVAAKTRWITAFHEATGWNVEWPQQNHGFAIMQTNPRNVAIFNNGTYHINITAPTLLDKNAEILNWPEFEHRHRMAARMFQWITPFLIARYGSADPLANFGTHTQQFPAGSQRLAASRYVSAGTYDTAKMPTGKLLTKPRSEVRHDWMRLTTDKAYQVLDTIGFDINFHKFPLHGLEFRIFDWVPETQLLEILRICVQIFDQAERAGTLKVPQDSVVWQRVLHRSVWEGANAVLNQEECKEFGTTIGVPLLVGPSGYLSMLDALGRICMVWNYQDGPCSRRMIRDNLHPITPNLQLQKESWIPTHSIELVVRVKFLRPSMLTKPHPTPLLSHRQTLRQRLANFLSIVRPNRQTFLCGSLSHIASQGPTQDFLDRKPS